MEQWLDTGNKDLLHDLQEEIIYEPAAKMLRFANFVIDFIMILVAAFIGMVAFYAFTSSNEDMSDLDVQLIVTGTYIGYYSIMEGLLHGRTVGKMITKTRVIRQDGKQLSLWKAFVRSLCRLVPFEPFSGFGDAPLHDKWTDTKVVKYK